MRTFSSMALCALVGVMTLAPAALGQSRFATLYSVTDGYPTGLSPIGGALYSATVEGACGTVIELQPPSAVGQGWTGTVLYTFADTGGDACSPIGGPVAGADGTLYGLSISGGAYGYGAMYELLPPASAGGAWTESVAYSFNGPSLEIGFPVGPLSAGPDGSFYLLVTYAGGSLLQLQPPAGPGSPWSGALLSVIGDGGSWLTTGPHGEIYGTTEYGGPGCPATYSN
jgi:hypothetical protein